MINAMTLEQIAEITQAEIFNNSHKVILRNTVSKDTRTLKVGDLSIALTGENFDGHAFVNKAIELQAAAAVGDEVLADCTLVQFNGTDTMLAMGQLAGFNRH